LRSAQIESQARWISIPGDREQRSDWSSLLEKFETVVLVSDAGTPVVSDPGVSLLQWARAQKIRVEALPGPCAPVLAWSWSGGFGLPFVFAGFPPRDRAGRKEFFGLLSSCRSFCFFESKHHARQTLEVLGELGGLERRIFVAREMTKTHEELLDLSVSEAIELADSWLGELTFLVQGDGQGSGPKLDLDQLLQIRHGSAREVSKILAALVGGRASDFYKRILELDDSSD
jgi:16S rRNA (cytidine1402-2'-O)-methyltransferase